MSQDFDDDTSPILGDPRKTTCPTQCRTTRADEHGKVYCSQCGSPADWPRVASAPTPTQALDGLFNAATMGIGGTRATELFNVVSGALRRERATNCAACNGRGGRYVQHPNAEGRYVDIWQPCAECSL